MSKPFSYGGQAVLEGVMMRGSRVMAVAVRHPAGHVFVQTEKLDEKLYRGPISRIPFLRGLITLWDTLGLGMKALKISAEVALSDDEEVTLSGSASWGLGLGLGVLLFVVLFIALPSFLSGLVAPYLPAEWLASLIEGVIRLFLIVGYIWAVGFMPDVGRLFAYHGAEHKTIHAYEAGVALEVEKVRDFSTAHTRCGTSFLLVLVILTVLLFAPFGRPSLLLRVASRVVLIPVIAGISYELIRLLARLIDYPLVRVLIAPNLLLQRLTTREPDDGMLEVAVTALKAVLKGEGMLEERAGNGHPGGD